MRNNRERAMIAATCEHGPPTEGGIYTLVFYKHGASYGAVSQQDSQQNS
jgi:hypothetical protein